MAQLDRDRQCTNSSCSTSTQLDVETLGTAPLGTAVKVELQVGQPNHKSSLPWNDDQKLYLRCGAAGYDHAECSVQEPGTLEQRCKLHDRPATDSKHHGAIRQCILKLVRRTLERARHLSHRGPRMENIRFPSILSRFGVFVLPALLLYASLVEASSYTILGVP